MSISSLTGKRRRGRSLSLLCYLIVLAAYLLCSSIPVGTNNYGKEEDEEQSHHGGSAPVVADTANSRYSCKLCVVANGASCSIRPCADGNNANACDQQVHHYGGGTMIVRRDDDDGSGGGNNAKGGSSLRGNVPRMTGSVKAGSACVQSDVYEFIFVHVLKSGGVTTKEFLMSANDHANNSTAAANNNNNNNRPLRSKQRGARVGGQLFFRVNCARAIRENPSYLVWSFVRNPYSRYYSGYAMANSINYRKGNRYNRNGVEHPPFGFDEYVTSTTNERRSMSRLNLGHFSPQSWFLFDNRGCPAFDFVGRLEHIDEDMNSILRKINSPELTKQFQDVQGGKMRNGKTNFGARAKEKIGASTFSLRRLYDEHPDARQQVLDETRADFDNFGYNPDLPPFK